MERIGTALVTYVCPICGKVADSAILINKQLTKKAAKEVNDLHNKSIGYSDNACEECSKYKDDVIFFIGIIPEKSDNTNVYRTGHIAGIKKDSDFVKNVPSEFILKTANDVEFCFIDIACAKEIGLFKE